MSKPKRLTQHQRSEKRGGKVPAVRPLNEKAWALYGGSPIFGPMWVADDNHDDLDPDVVALLLGDEDWVGPEIRRSMDAFLRRGN